jgi:hypothetical protein
MQLFTFYIDDDRRPDTVRISVTIPNGVPVRKHAQGMLDQNQHYRQIEVRVAATSLFSLGSPSEKEPQAS